MTRPLALAACLMALAGPALSDPTELSETGSCPGCDLSKAGFADQALVGANLTGAILEDGDFSTSNLFLAQLDDARADRVNFRNASLKATTFVGASLRGADFRGADLSGARLKDADITDARFDGAILCNTVMPDGELSRDSCQ